ncbi:DUF4921 family protein [Pirellulales bacterium]|nr:DUF4921 family protein [Pirellulales bacterium]
MPELRIDPVTGRQVLIAPNRSLRPQPWSGEVADNPGGNSDDDCPFCAGHESQTPPAEYESTDDEGKWQVRVVPNKYPAIVPPCGSHEVVIESPRHATDWPELSVDELTRIVLSYRDRMQRHLEEAETAYVSVFKNSGPEAGASLPHVHSQILRLPEVPAAVQLELDAAGRHWQASRTCLFCDLAEAELRDGARTVLETDTICGWTTYAGRQAYEMWFLPRGHESRFERLDTATARDLADALHRVLTAMARLMPRLSYNLALHTAPREKQWDQAFHWHWELIPRVSRLAGLELGSGMFINTLAPEDAAERLRELC